MAITFTGLRKFSTGNMPGHMFSSATVASQCFKLRIESAATAGIPDGLITFDRSNGFCFKHSFLHGAGPAVPFTVSMDGSGAGGASHQFPLTVGVTYVVVVVWDGSTPVQKCWINGVPTVMAHVASVDSSWGGPAEMGPNLAQSAIVYTLDDYHSWDNYALTQSDAVYLTNNGDPTTVGTGAPWRCRWTLDGTTGHAAAIGDAGLKNAYGTGGADGSDFASVTGTGTAVYADALVWEPTVTPHPYVAGCGKIIGFTFTGNFDGLPVTPSQLLATPTIKINGVDQGALVKAWGGHQTGVHQCLLFSTPGTPPIEIGPDDAAELTSPPAWANTPAGSVAALAGTIDNRSGGSSVQVESLPKTLRMGLNNPSPGGMEYYPFRNAKFKIGNPAGSGKLPPGHGYNLVNQPCESGLIRVIWDATKPTTPAILTLQSNQPTRVTVTHRGDLDISPGDGIGFVRIYQATYVAGSDYLTVAGGSGIGINYDDPAFTGTPNYANLWIELAGEWDTSQPAVFDRSDPWLPSRIYQDRVQSTGSMRAVDMTACGGSCLGYPFPELLLSPNTETWFGFNAITKPKVGFLSIGPVDPVATPYFYSALFREPANQFLATLSDTIVTAPAVGTNETWHFSDGATAPLMAGLEVQVDNEIVRILSGSGTTWLVYRGSNGTTPATHSQGTVVVFGRQPITKKVRSDGTAGYTAPSFVVCDAPHGLTTMHTYFPQGKFPMTMADGTVEPNLALSSCFVTGPTTFVSIWSGWYSKKPAGTKPSTTYTLDPTTHYLQRQYFPHIPLEIYLNLVGRFPHADLHYNVPLDACDDMVYEMAWRCRDNFPSGRRIFVEYANEPWNWAPPFRANLYCVNDARNLMMPQNLNTYPLAYYAYRFCQIHRIFREVFTAAGRGSEIYGIANCQMASGSSQVTPHLEFALAQGQPLGAIACAPYYSMGAYPASLTAFNQYDDDQAAEMLLHDITYDTSGNIVPWIKDVAGAVASYNSRHGKDCILIGYEGGIENSAPKGAVNHDSRNHDIQYNPNFYNVEQGWFKILQDNGFDRLHIYGLGIGWPSSWGVYHMRTQRHSRGDGRGGAADNRSLRMTPVTNIGTSTIKQDTLADSVRGQAFIDWNALIGATSATTFTLITPTPDSGLIDEASGLFTVRPNGSYTGTITITPSGGGLSTPIVLTWSSSSAAKTFTITPTVAGTVTLTPTNSGSLVNPGAVTYLATAATAYSFDPPNPSSGLVAVLSEVFTVQPNGPYTGTITIAVDGGGLSTSIVLTWASSSVSRTFAITPTLEGTVTLTPTNSGGLTDQDPLSYTVTLPPGSPLTVWFGSWFGRWFTVAPSVGGIVRGGESATSFLDVDAPRLQRRFIPASRRSFHKPGR